MTIDLYYAPRSAPCRAVLFTAKILGIELVLKQTNLQDGEHLKPEFLKMNPQHTIPTLNDNGFSIWESKAINIYLVEKYGKGSSLYPTDPDAKAVVNQRLFFDNSVLYQRYADAYYPYLFRGATIDPEKVKKLEEAFEFLEIFLTDNDYVAGNVLTVADISIVTSVTTARAVEFGIGKYKNVNKWLAKMQSIPGYAETNGKGIEIYEQFYASRKAKK